MIGESTKKIAIRGVLLAGFALFWPSLGVAEETVCIQCHGAQEGYLGEPVALWRDSIHAENGNSCHGCHGGDPTDFEMAMSPERGFVGVPDEEDIPAFCGRCHVGVKDDYLQSAHGQALGEGGPTCVTCHGNHAVKKASSDLINPQDCSRCHEYGRAEEIKAAVVGTDQLISGLNQDLDKLHRLGIRTKELQGKVFAQRNEFHRLFHSVDVDQIKAKTAGFEKELGTVRERIDEISGEFGQRKLWGGIAVALLLALGVLFTLMRKTYQEEE